MKLEVFLHLNPLEKALTVLVIVHLELDLYHSQRDIEDRIRCIVWGIRCGCALGHTPK
jgi:hypothetical protein